MYVVFNMISFTSSDDPETVLFRNHGQYRSEVLIFYMKSGNSQDF